MLLNKCIHHALMVSPPNFGIGVFVGFYHIKSKSKTGSHAARLTHPIYQDFAKTNRLEG